MSRSAAARIASRVVLPSRVLAVELRGNVGVLVVVICTNQSVQKLPPVKHRVKPELDSPTRTRNPERQAPRSVTAPPRRSEPPKGVKGALRGPLRKKVTAPPGRPEPPRGLRGPFEAP